MVQQTQADNSDETTIESVDIMNDDLIDVLTSTVTYERTNGARGRNRLMAVVGDGPHKMLVPCDEDGTLPDEYSEMSVYDLVHATSLVGKSELMDTISVCGQDADLQVL